ncbi:MAG: hypothetical protein JWN70_3412 [Planctomycetaceae bacterium]|nr:hypothetical protein [Planctomycetaceae bacterium]
MSIASSTGEKLNMHRSDLDFQAEVDRAFLKRFPKGRRLLVIYRMKMVWDWSFREIGESVGLSGPYCQRAFNQALERLEMIRREHFADHVPAGCIDDGEETPEGGW